MFDFDCSWFFLPVNPRCIITTSSSTTTEAPTTTTTTTEIPITTTTTTTNAIINCLNGLVIETIYLASPSDVDLLPEGYNHPCIENIGTHVCNRAFFELYGNGVYMADSLLSNNGGVGGPITYSGRNTCEDYHNTLSPLTGGVWTGGAYSRYSKTILTQEQAIAIANAGGSNTTIDVSFLSAMLTYSATCDMILTPHNGVNWLRISTPEGVVLWNSCIEGNNVYSIDVCNGITTTTTTLI